MSRMNKRVFSFIITSAALLVLFFAAVNTGSLKVGFGELYRGLFVRYDENVATIYDLRFPRIFIAMTGGAATAVSGVLLQAVMKNPLADPGIIGVSSGATFTAVIVTAFFPTLFFMVSTFAFMGGMTAQKTEAHAPSLPIRMRWLQAFRISEPPSRGRYSTQKVTSPSRAEATSRPSSP